jgi:hypothetical protein
MQTRRNCCIQLLITLGLGKRLAADSPAPELEGLVRQIDHVLICSEQPEKLYKVFADQFGLPVAWSFQSFAFQSERWNGSFSSGGVSFSNANIELCSADAVRDILRFKQTPQSGLTGMAFEPKSFPDLLHALDARGLRHDPAEPYYLKDSAGSQRLVFTLVQLRDLPPTDGARLFFCKYNSEKIDEGRAELRRELEKQGGGPLGIEFVAEIVVGVRDIATAERDWRALMGPLRSGQEHFWQPSSGPAIRLIADKTDRLALVRVKVKSLERARSFLKAQNLLGRDTGRQVSLNPSHTAGADIWFLD